MRMSLRLLFAACSAFVATLVLSVCNPAVAQQVQPHHPHGTPALPHTPWSPKPHALGKALSTQPAAPPSQSLNISTWTALGPASLNDNGFSSATTDLVSGRVTGIAVDPTDSNTIYETAAGGGVWKTTDGGTTWTPLTDNQVTLAMGAIAIAPTDHLKIYAGTGEANNSGDSNHGYGILVSNDGGATWSLATAGGAFTGNVIGQIAVDPTNENIAYAAVGGYSLNGVFGYFGIYKTTDGGTNWTNVTGAAALDTNTPWSAVVVDPNTPTIIYAAMAEPFYATANAVYRSLDSGATWAELANAPNGGEPLMGRIALAVSPAAKTAGQHVLYVAVAQSGNSGNSGLSYFVRSNNADAATPTFTDLTAGTPDFLGAENGDGQGWYDIAVNVDANGVVYCAGVEDYESIPEGLQAIIMSKDLGVTWNDISIVNNVEPHTDNHAIAFDSSNRMVDGNDGGIFRYDPTGSGAWTDLNANLNTIQFQGISLHPTHIGTVLGGSQDNGTELYSDDPVWVQVQGGDGGPSQISQNNPARCYAEYFGVSLTRSDNSCAPGTFFDVSGGIFASPKIAVEVSDFYVPYTVDPTNGDHVLYGTDYINDTTDGGDSWIQIGVPGTNNFNPNDEATDTIALSPVQGLNPAVIYVSVGGSFALSSEIFVAQENGTSTTWTERDLPACDLDLNPTAFSQGCRVSKISVDPNDVTGHTAFAVTSNYTAGSGHVWRTTNEGQTWRDVTHDLPNQPVWSVQIDSDANQTAYVSTDSGVYASASPYTSWTQFGTGLPNAQGVDLQLNRNLHVLAVGTHGRGAWEIETEPILSVGQNFGGQFYDTYLKPLGLAPAPITSSPAGINCGAFASPLTCSAGFSLSSVVTLTAPSNEFTEAVSWTGCDSVSSDETTCTVTMTDSKSAGAAYLLLPTMTWPAASAITYGQALSSSTLTGGSAVLLPDLHSINYPVPGSFTFDSPTTVPGVGAQTEAVTFTPTDTTQFAVVHGTVNVTVNQAPLTVTVNNQTMTYGSSVPTLTGTVTGVVAGDGITASYFTSATSSSPAGPYAITATLNDPNSKLSNYTVTNTPGTLTISKASPTVSWPAASAITYGQALSSSTLTGGSASLNGNPVAGSFTFDSPATTPAAGAQSEAVTFTPTDTTNLVAVHGSVSVTVNKATPTVTWPTASAITYGQALSSSTLTGGSATLNGNSVAGTFAFDSPTTIPVAGAQSEAVTFTPTDTTNLVAVHGSVSVTVNKASPTITWPTPAAITYGTALGATQLNATASVPGAFVYAPAAGTVLGGGAQTLSTTFNPTDAIDYSSATASVTLTVNPATPVIAVSSSQNPATIGQSVTFTAAVSSPAGTPSGSVTFWDGTTQLGSGTLAAGMATYSTATLAAGSHTITAQYSGDANFAPVTSTALTQTVSNFSIGPANGAPTSANIAPGGVANFLLTVTPPGSSPVTFTVAGLPSGAVSSFSPGTVAAGAGPTTVQFIINLPSQSASAPQKQGPFSRTPLAFGLLLLPFLGLRKSVRRGSRFLFLAILAIAGAVSVITLSGCGGKANFSGSNAQTPEGAYNLTVTATAGTQTQTTSLTLNVQ